MRFIPPGKPMLDERHDFTASRTPGLRVYRDRDGTRWFEVSPGEFSIGEDLADAEDRAARIGPVRLGNITRWGPLTREVCL